MHKTIIMAIMLILSISLVSAGYRKTTERVILEEGKSAELNGKRLTLLNLDFENERVIVCVNGEKTILSKSKTKTINEATLDLRKVTMNKAEIRMWVTCIKCECDESCDISCSNECYENKDCDDKNDLTEDKCYGTPKKCYNEKIEEITEFEEDEEIEIEKVTGATTYKISETSISNPKLMHMFLVGIIFVLIVAIIYKKFIMPKY